MRGRGVGSCELQVRVKVRVPVKVRVRVRAVESRSRSRSRRPKAQTTKSSGNRSQDVSVEKWRGLKDECRPSPWKSEVGKSESEEVGYRKS